MQEKNAKQNKQNEALIKMKLISSGGHRNYKKRMGITTKQF